MDCKTDGIVENDLFINTGELFDIWTNGYWKGNMHRVIMNNEKRITFTYFSGPDQNLMIEPIEGCYVCNKEEQKYISRTAAQHALWRFSQGDLSNPDGLKFFSDDL